VVPLLETEKRAIMDALGFTKGDRGRAATLLQISRTTLYRKLKEYSIGE
jgi:DNA-binding NtrC family response regulator